RHSLRSMSNYNSHGDVVKIKGPSGNVLNTYEYDIWGNLLVDKVKETMPNPFAYAGEMYDKESNFYYLRARYYDPKMGRFISEDTVKGQVDNPLSLNRYTYVSNNPLKYVDPSGHINVGVGEGNSGTYYYFDNEGVRRIHGTKEIDWQYYREWFEKDQAGMQDALRGTNKIKNSIAAQVTWDWAMENGVPIDGGGAGYSVKAPGVKLGTKNTITNTIKGTGNVATTRVGRWMSREEYDTMVKTGKVPESYTGTTYVANPADANAFGKQAKPGSIYVEFDVPTSSLKQTNEGWAKIVGPNSLEGRLAAKKGQQIPQMPSATNIRIVGEK
ncbi:MAG: RHS repeat-associated core domain-containing protein, partial [Bacillota bacterium]